MLHQWQADGRHWLLIRRSLSDPSDKAYYARLRSYRHGLGVTDRLTIPHLEQMAATFQSYLG